MSSTTRFPDGVTNVGEESMFANMRQLSPVGYHTFMDDFNYWPSGWTETLSGGATIQAAPPPPFPGQENGWIAISQAGVGWGANIVMPPSFKPGQKPLFFETKLYCGSQFQIYVGLKSQYSENMLFAKNDNSNEFYFSNRYDGGAMPLSTNLPTAVVDPAGSEITLGFVIEPDRSIKLFVNRQFAAVANGLAAQLAMGPQVSSQSYSSASADPIYFDYILASKERV